jgi:hypothetical protein
MKSVLPKYELKPRSGSGGGGKKTGEKKKSDKFINRMIVCVRHPDDCRFSENEQGALFRKSACQNRLFSRRADGFRAAAEKVGDYVNGFVAKLLGENVPADNTAYNLQFPVEQGEIVTDSSTPTLSRTSRSKRRPARLFMPARTEKSSRSWTTATARSA